MWTSPATKGADHRDFAITTMDHGIYEYQCFFDYILVLAPNWTNESPIQYQYIGKILNYILVLNHIEPFLTPLSKHAMRVNYDNCRGKLQ